MGRGKKFRAAAIFFSLMFFVSAAKAQTTARAAAVIELKTGRVLYAHNENTPLPMASTTKIMTALLALEHGKLSDTVVTGERAYGVAGTSIYLSRGEELTLEEMLYGLMLASGNDAAVAIAEHIGGTVEGFAEMMNQKAAELKAQNTHFVTPHGLPCENHYTTALDLALISRHAMQHPVFREIVSTQRASIPWEGRDSYRVLKNKNRLLSTYEGATGIKTGYTKAAGRCLAFGARQDGMEIVGVVLHCGNWFDEAARLMDEAFSAYRWHEALPDGARCGQVPVEDGEKESVRICLSGALGGPIKEDERMEVQVEITPCVRAPLPAGAQVGWVALMANGEEIAKTPVVTAEPARQKQSALERVLVGWLLQI